jgi:ABC-2 type transport system permease protein
MSTTLVANTNRPLAKQARIFLLEAKCEFLMLFRNKTFALATIGFPVMFYVLFGVADKHVTHGNMAMAKYMLGGYACFGLIGAALFGIGVAMASERSSGWLELKQASPMPVLAYLAAKGVTAIAFGLTITTVLCAVGVTLGGVQLSLAEFASMLAIAGVGAVPFAAMGMFMGLVMPANASAGIVNLVYLPLSFCSGLWIPIMFLPKMVQQAAFLSPVYHLAQLMENCFGYASSPAMASHWIALAGFLMLMMGASWAVFQRAQQDA